MGEIHESTAQSQKPCRLPEKAAGIGKLATGLPEWTHPILLIAWADAVASNGSVADLDSLTQYPCPPVQERVLIHLLQMGETGRLSHFPLPVVLEVLRTHPEMLTGMSLEDVQALIAAGAPPQQIQSIASKVFPAPSWLAVLSMLLDP